MGQAAGRFLPLLLLLFLLFPLRSSAQGTTEVAGSAPAPLAGSGAISFVSQAVDGTLRPVEGGYVVDNRAVIRLHNTDRFNAAAITLGWPGWPGGSLRFDPAELPGFAPVRGGVGLPTRLESRATTWQGETREAIWLVAETTIAPDSRERIFFDWSQTVGNGPLLTYAFGLLPAGAWPGPVGSARVTLTLPRLLSEEAIVQAEPADYTFLGDQLEWLLVEREPLQNPRVTFVAPHLWAEIEETRDQVASAPVGANLRLAELYESLAAAGAANFAARADTALLAAYRADPNRPEAARRLYERYRARALETEDPALLNEALLYGEAALASGEQDPTLRAAVAADLVALALDWEGEAPEQALDFLDRAAPLAPDPALVSAHQQRLAERVALSRLNRGDDRGAAEIAARYGLPDAALPLPWLDELFVRIENGPAARRVTLEVDGPPEEVAARMSALVDRLRLAGTRAGWESPRLWIELAGPPAGWAAAAQQAGALLPADPELDLLRSALPPRDLQYEMTEGRFEVRFSYQERLVVDSRVAAVVAEAQGRRAAATSPLLQARLDGIEQRWRHLDESQGVEVITRFADGAIERAWTVRPPADDLLRWEERVARPEQILTVAAAAAALLLLLAALIWLPGRSRRGEPWN